MKRAACDICNKWRFDIKLKKFKNNQCMIAVDVTLKSILKYVEYLFIDDRNDTVQWTIIVYVEYRTVALVDKWAHSLCAVCVTLVSEKNLTTFDIASVNTFSRISLTL